MARPAGRSIQWVYYLAAGFMFGAVFLRSLLVYQDRPELPAIRLILLAFLLLWALEPAVSRRLPACFILYLPLQTAAVFVLLSVTGVADFFAALLSILSMQVMLRLSPRAGALWLALVTVIMAGVLARNLGGEALPLTLIYTAANVLFGSYALATRRAQDAHGRTLALAGELAAGNRKLQDYAARLEGLAAARERNRLARELHDSVTQTVFSMNLTSQSALLLLGRDRAQAADQLERLGRLAHSALAEMQLLIVELRPERVPPGGLAEALRRHLAGSRFPAGLNVTLAVEGDGQPTASSALSPAEEAALFGIAQEALNNVVKHARSSRAEIRLHLDRPAWLEIADQGQGFDPQAPLESGRVGLTSMAERAAEIGWRLVIASAPGAGTRVRVSQAPAAEEHP